jgi:hypothetical protein
MLPQMNAAGNGTDTTLSRSFNNAMAAANHQQQQINLTAAPFVGEYSNYH